MNIPVGKKIVSTVIEDIRFLEGDNIVAALGRVDEFGKTIDIYFEDNTYIRVEALKDRYDVPLMGIHTGKWKTSANNEIEKVS